MGGFFGVAAKDDCMFDLFLEPITTHILVQDAEEWPFTAKKDLIVRFTTLRMHHSEPNSTKICRR